MDITTILGASAGLMTASSMIPQLVKIIKNKKVEDVSVWMLLLLIVGVSLWIVYGFMKNDIFIICTNIFSALVNIFTLVMRIKFKKE